MNNENLVFQKRLRKQNPFTGLNLALSFARSYVLYIPKSTSFKMEWLCLPSRVTTGALLCTVDIWFVFNPEMAIVVDENMCVLGGLLVGCHFHLSLLQRQTYSL